MPARVQEAKRSTSEQSIMSIDVEPYSMMNVLCDTSNIKMLQLC